MSEGYLEKNPQNNKYHLGIKVLFLCDAILSKIPYRGRAYPILRELAKITGETVVLVLYSEGKAICIEKIESTSTVKMSCSLGQTFNLHRGSTGLSLLMGMPPEMMREILYCNIPLSPLSDKTITDRKKLSHLSKKTDLTVISHLPVWSTRRFAISSPSCLKDFYLSVIVLGRNTADGREKASDHRQLKKSPIEMTAIITLNS